MKYNFKNVAFYAAAILTIGAFSACSDELEIAGNQLKETKTITFTATLGEDDPSSRTSHVMQGDGSMKVSWVVDDKLYVGLSSENVSSDGTGYLPVGVNGSGYKTAMVTSVSNNGKTATFTMEVDDSWTEGQNLNVFYGKDTNLQKEDGAANLRIQTTDLDYKDFSDYFSNYDFMFARATYNKTGNTLSDFTLTHCVSFIKLNLNFGLETVSDFNVLSITTVDNSYVFPYYISVDNSGTISYEDASARLAIESYADNVSMTTTENKATVYMCVPPTVAGTESFDIKITASRQTDNRVTESYSGSLYNIPALGAGKLYNTPEVTLTKNTLFDFSAFNCKISGDGTWNSEDLILVTGQNGVGGWEFNSMDLTPYKYLVVEFDKAPANDTRLTLYSEASVYGKSYTQYYSHDKRIVFDIQKDGGYTASDWQGNTDKLDLTSIRIIGIQSNGGHEIDIKDIYVTNELRKPDPADLTPIEGLFDFANFNPTLSGAATFDPDTKTLSEAGSWGVSGWKYDTAINIKRSGEYLIAKLSGISDSQSKPYLFLTNGTNVYGEAYQASGVTKASDGYWYSVVDLSQDLASTINVNEGTIYLERITSIGIQTPGENKVSYKIEDVYISGENPLETVL